MNNSKFAVDSVRLEEEVKPDRSEHLKGEEARLIRILEALRAVQSSEAWSSLKIEIFDSLVPKLERDLKEEAKKDNPDTHKLNRIAGQLKWAEKYANLSKLENGYLVELQGTRLQIGN